MAYFSPYAPAAQEIAEQGYPKYEDDPDYYNQWWDTQILRCINGYSPRKGDRISGDFYFHLNFVHGEVLDFRTQDKRIRQFPYTDLDHEQFDFLEKCENDHVGALILKGRRAHFTTNIASKLLARWSFSPGTTLGVGTYDVTHLEKIRGTINIARSLLPPELSYNAIDNPKLLEASYKVKSDAGQKNEGTFSRIHYECFGGKTLNVGAFRSKSLKIHLFDEIGENPVLFDCIDASEECWKEGDHMYGLPVCGGTSNLMKNPSKDIQEFFENPEARGFRKLFIPRHRFYFVVGKNFIDPIKGTSTKEQQEKAKKYIDHKAEEYFKLPNKTKYYTFLQENPTEEAHMFMGNSSSALLPLDKINGQIKILNDYDSLKNRVRKYNLYWKNGRYDPQNPQVEWDTTCDEGEYWIIEMPDSRYKNLDIGGVDTYFKSLSDAKDKDRTHSKGAMYVYRRDNPYEIESLTDAPIAEYIARYDETHDFYDGCLKLSVAYSHKNAPMKMLSEYDEAFYAFMDTANALRYFREKPTALDTEWTQTTNKYMITMSGPVKIRLGGLVNQYCNRHIKNIGFTRLLEDMRGFGTRNTDPTMAFGITLIHDLDMRNNLVVDKGQREEDNDPFPSFTRQNGILVPTYSVPKTTIHNFLNT